MIENRSPRRDLFAVILIVLAVFLSLSLLTYRAADPVGQLFAPLDKMYQPDVLVWPQNETVQNACGNLGAITADVLLTTLGYGSFFLVIGILAVAIALLQQRSIEAIWTKTFGWLLAVCGMTTVANMLVPYATLGPVIGPGGYLGALGAGLMKMHFAGTGGLIMAASVLAIGMFMWTEYIFVKVIGYCLVSILTVFAFVIPSRMIEKVQSLFGLSESDEEEEFEDDEEELVIDDADKGRRKSMFADTEDDVELEAATEEEDEEDEYEEDEEPETIPFVAKTAAKTAQVVDEVEEDDEDEYDYEEDDEEDEEAEEEEPTPKKRGGLFGLGRKKKASPEEEARQQVISQLNQASLADEDEDYDLPEVDLLGKSKVLPKEEVMKTVSKTGRLLEQKFAEFGQNIRVVDVETGPVITQYELDLEKGLRLNKVVALEDDIAVGLRVPNVRVVPSIPGKNTVGIEVPNEKRQFVRLRDVMEASTEAAANMKIPLFLGQDVAGNHMVSDLSTLPHLLIAGRTGTGKSVCLNAIINSILMTRRPDEVRMLMIDPKMVEMSGYSRIPHLMHPVVTDMKKAEAILEWAVEKMEDRYRLMARAGVRHINSYNQLGEEELMDRLGPTDEERDEIPINMPFIVIIADEMADLMMTATKEVEAHIIRLAQKSRAVGIHLILATQKPIVQVVTSLIKSNLPARIAFQVSSSNDSRVVLDENGAEKLLGNGDMLFLGPGTSKLVRGQGTFVSDEEIDAITESISTGEQDFVSELINLKVKDDSADEEVDDAELAAKLAKRDALYHKAVEIVINEQRGSCSLLQRALRIGYGRAARVIDHMHEDGVVGPYNGSSHREVIMTMAQWEAFQAGNLAGDGKVSTKHLSVEPVEPKPKRKPAKKKAPAKVTSTVEDIAPVKASLPTPDVNAELEDEIVFEEIDDHEDDQEIDSDPPATIAISSATAPAVDDDIEDDEEEWEYEEVDEDEIDEDDADALAEEEEEEDYEEVEEDEHQELEDDDEGPVASAEDDDEYEWEYEEVDEDESDEDDEYEYEYEYVDE